MKQITGLCLLIAALPLFGDGSLRVRFVRGAEKGPITVRLSMQGKETVKTIPAGSSEMVFDRLASGRYDLLVAGDEPLKRLATFAHVTSGETLANVELPSGVVLGRLTLGGAPFQTELTLTHWDEDWSTTLTTGKDGAWDSVVWHRGDFEVAIGRGRDRMPVGKITIPKGIAPRADFDVPDRQVTGRVTTPDGAPARGVALAFEMRGETRRVIRRTTDDDGAFLYFGVPAGSHTLRVVSAAGHLQPDPVDITLRANDSLREVAILLKRGVRRTVRIVDHHDEPSAGATLLCVSGGEIRSSATTDAKGVAAFDTPLRDDSTLYVLPREGSLAIRALDASESGGALRIRVPPPDSSIDLVAKRTDGTAMAEVGFLMRFNGETIPPVVVREMQQHQRIRLRTDEQGLARLLNVPTGFYEFWPVRTDDEIAAILETEDILEPPISLNARAGANRVTVRFARRY